MSNPNSPEEAAARLARALYTKDELTPEAAAALLPEFILAERSGEDVDNNPAYAALLRHLDHNEASLRLYEQLSEDMDLLLDPAETLPTITGVPPSFFSSPTLKGEHVLLQVLQGMVRRFRLTINMPRLAPALATLSGSQQALFAGTLTEVAGTPLLSLSTGHDQDGPWMRVLVRDTTGATRWQIQLIIGDETFSATTDERGLAHFSLPALPEPSQVQMVCEEVRG
ncbi:MAG: hypothetical protein EOM24_15080 [Chloroflexia bacterium]|nr:hypothetical protein [Chloroflexia bacterium]